MIAALWPLACCLALTGQAAGPPQTAPAGAAALRGTIVDARTAAPVGNARVVLTEVNRSVLTGPDGRFEFAALSARAYTLTVSLIGYGFVRRAVTLAAGEAVDLTIPLAEGTGSYRETITVTGDPTPPPELGVPSQVTLGSAALQDLRGIAADDPLRAMQALPGVTTGDDFQAQFSMRGFSFRQVGLVMDGTASPLLLHEVRGESDTGSIAMINSDVLGQASLFAGPHPLKDGDWLGSTLSFEMRDGSRDRTGVRLAVSGTSASTVLEGPIGRRKKGSWLLSVRKSYIDWLVKKIAPGVDDTIGFIDTQARIVYDLSSRQQISASFVGGNAHLDQPMATSANTLRHASSEGGLASVAWRYSRSAWIFNQRVSFVGSNFLNTGAAAQVQGRGTTPSVMYRGDAGWRMNDAWTVEFGARADSEREHLFLANFTTTAGVLRQRADIDLRLADTAADGWAQIARRTPRAGVAVGSRLARDSYTGRTVASPWLLLEGRVGFVTFKAGAGQSHQFPSLDLQAGSATPLRPENATSVDAGVESPLGHGFHLQATGWTRDNSDLTRRTGEDRVVNGRRVAESLFPQFASTLTGPSHGVDLTLSRQSATGVSGWVGYTYAHTRFRDTVTGEQFDGDFDQRHTLNVFLQARLSYRLAVNARWRVGSNYPLVGYFAGTTDNLTLSTLRNQVRLPYYSRLDLRLNRTFTFDKRRLTLFVEVMNVLNRYNLGQSQGSISSITLAARGYTDRMLPRLPSAGLLFEF